MMENSLLIYKKNKSIKKKVRFFTEFIDNSDINGYSKDTCKEA